MKLKLVLSLLLIILSKGIKEKNNAKNIFVFTENIQGVTDSVNYYYKKSRSKEYDLKKRLHYIDKAILLSSKRDNKSSFLKMLSYKSAIYGNTKKNYSEAIKVAMILKDEAEIFDNQEYIAKAFNKLGRYSDNKKEYLDAYDYYKESLKNYKELNDSLNVIKVSRRIADIQNIFGAYIDAENSVVEALPYSETLKDASELSWLYNVLAIVNRNQKLYSEAIDNHLKALRYEDNEKSTITLKNNYAVTLIESERYPEAIAELEPLLKNKDSLKIDTYSRMLDNLAHAKSKLQYADAEELFREALKLRESISDLEGEFASHIHLADYYENNKNNVKSLFYIEKAYLIAQQIKSPDAIVEALSLLVPYKKELFSKYRALKDSITDADLHNRNQFAKRRYDFEKTEIENLKLREEKAQKDLEISKSQTRNLLLLFGILLLSLISLVVYYIQKQKTKQKVKISKIQERYQTETRLSKKVHDEVGNDVFYLMTQIENDPSLLEKNGLKLLDGLQNIYSKARDISREYTNIDTGEGFPEELLSLLNSFGNKEVKIITKQLEPAFWTPIDADLKSEVFRIVQELLTNMKKHSQASFVGVTFKKESQKLTIQYSDNGIGVDGEKPTLKSVENRIQVLKGVLTLDAQSDEGLQVSIVIPI